KRCVEPIAGSCGGKREGVRRIDSGRAGNSRCGETRLGTACGHASAIMRTRCLELAHQMYHPTLSSSFSRLSAKPLRTLRTGVAFVVIAALIGGCNLFPEVKDPYANFTAEQLYRQGKDAMAEGNFTKAVKVFEALEARYPYGRYAQQAILEGAYA